MGAAFSTLYPSLSLHVVNQVPANRRGVALGTFTAFFDVGMAIGGPIVGVAAALWGYGAAFWVGAGAALAPPASFSCSEEARLLRFRRLVPRARLLRVASA